MGSMRNGSGDDFFAHFSDAGCWLKGFAHEYPMSPYRQSSRRVWPGVLDAVPKEFESCLHEPAFSVEDTTFCIWRRTLDERWQLGPIQFPGEEDPDGSQFLLSNLDARPITYQTFAQEYYDCDVDLRLVEHIYAHRPLTEGLVVSLNPKLTLRDLTSETEEIGYPAAPEVHDGRPSRS